MMTMMVKHLYGAFPVWIANKQQAYLKARVSKILSDNISVITNHKTISQ